MALRLNIPYLKDDPLIPAETRLQKINELLISLHSKKPLNAGSHIHGELEILNRQKVAAHTRIQILDAYRPLLISTTQALADDYTTSTLPLQDHAKLSATVTELLWLELGYGYKLALVDLQNQLFKLGTDRHSAHAIQRAMHAISEHAILYYQTYVPVPENIWSDLHQLYFCAIQLGIHTIKLRSENPLDEKAPPQATIESTYKHALLMSLTAPQHLTPKNIRCTTDYLAFLLDHAKISALTQLSHTDSCFIINLTSNKPPTPIIKQKETPNLNTDILLQTNELISTVQRDLNILLNNQLPKDHRITADANRNEYVDLLTDLLKYWGETPKRGFNRTKTNHGLEIISGISAIHHASNHVEYDPFAMNTIVIDEPNKTSLVKTSRWQAMNISATGLAARRHPTAEKNIRVGGLLGFKTKDQNGWSLGLVRWASCDKKDGLDIGIELIAPYAQSAMSRINSSEFDEMLLLLPEIVATKQPASIIAPIGTFAPNRQLSISHHDTSLPITLTKVLERTPQFEWIQFISRTP